MQLFSRNKALAALSLGALAALGACGDDVTVPPAVTPAETVSISPSNANMNIGESLNFAVQISGGSATPTLASCTSSNTAVATAAVQGNNACRVTAVAAGNATVTAASSTGRSAAAAVSVAAAAPAISGLAVTPTASQIGVGQTVTIVPTVTRANPSVNVTYAYATSSSAIASVSPAGVVTAVAPGIATITVTATAGSTVLTTAAAVTVTALPAGITGLNVTPTAVTLSTGRTAQVVANVQQPSGAAAATLTYGTTAPAVATVSTSGLITAAGPGTAVITVTATSAANTNFAASTLSSSVAVTVNPAAQVSIANITSGTTNNPVNINNVTGQIQVQLNLATNNNNVSSVSLFVCEAGVDCTTGAPAARQNFGAAGAADGQVNLFINTADFTTDFATSTVRYVNGQKNLIAVLNVANANANSNLAILNFNNEDTFAARHTAPARSAVNTTTNVTFFGGPGAEGRGRVQIAPVIYTPGRSITRATVGLTGVCSGTLTFGGEGNPAFPIDYTFGYTLGTTAGANARNIVCAAASNPSAAVSPDVAPRVVSSIDNSQNAGPNAASAAAFASTTSSIPAVMTPAVIRVDYELPAVAYSLTAQNGGQLGWANAAYNFAATGMRTTTDAGVGLSAATSFVYEFRGCGSTTFASVATGADIAECGTDFTGGVVSGTDTRGPYEARLTVTDLLANSNSALTDNFGVDKTAPAIQFAVAVPADSSIITSAFAAGNVFQAEALDERAGLDDATAAQHFISIANQINPNGLCVVPAASTTNVPGTSFVTNPTCTFTATAASPLISTSPLTGYKQFTPVPNTLFVTEGYYAYSARAIDRAGNLTQPIRRRFLLNTSTPLVSGLGLPATVNATTGLAFTPNFAEAVEAWFTNFRVTFAGLPTPAGVAGSSLLYPATLAYTRFDNAIGLNGNTLVGTPFTSGTTFYTNLEHVNVATGAPIASGTASANTFRPTGVATRVYNVGGFVSALQPAALLDANIATDNARWTTKAANLAVWSLGSPDANWNSPADGLKATAISLTNSSNSPFSRVDFYEFVTGSDTYRYLGSVSGTAPNGSSIYLADNGTTRVWTYRLTSVVADSGSLTAGSLGSPIGRNFIAVGVANSATPAGRVLTTSPLAALSTYPAAAAPAGVSALAAFSNATVNLATSAVNSQTSATTFATPGALTALSFSCVSSQPAVATVSCSKNAATGQVTVTTTGLTVGSATITVVASTPNGVGFALSTVPQTFTVTVNP